MSRGFYRVLLGMPAFVLASESTCQPIEGSFLDEEEPTCVTSEWEPEPEPPTGGEPVALQVVSTGANDTWVEMDPCEPDVADALPHHEDRSNSQETRWVKGGSDVKVVTHDYVFWDRDRTVEETARGVPLRAPGRARVVVVDRVGTTGFGRRVLLEFTEEGPLAGLRQHLAHMHEVAPGVEVGAVLAAHDVVGTQGASGRDGRDAYGVHLHMAAPTVVHNAFLEIMLKDGCELTRAGGNMTQSDQSDSRE